ncbi:hypothetical protein RFI_13087 [Reticulomyxa filosa]|uniref:Ankyrin repeat domain-containing protein n=1 Tax=Reticulomyxa filosa TaxID=46433 RepID=X6NFF3_RETFI|nr:hypothetical protein RFI_13087 [Reticulomyxa filosa]|eukprot:ETO24072.1 hypothetical protein RFI_13087 [Reticulomyxa filosa]
MKAEEKDIDDSVEMLLQSELFAPELITADLQITQNTTWLGYPKNVDVNGKECASYTVSNLILLARRRNSHIPKEVKEAIRRKKKLLKEKTSSNTDDKSSSHLEVSENELTDSLNDLDIDKSKEQNQSRHLAMPSIRKKSRSPGPFAGKKEKLSKYVKRYDYPNWMPPSISMEQYFHLLKPSMDISTHVGKNPSLQISEDRKDEDDNENTEVNFFTNPVMESPMTTPRGGSLLSRVFQKKKKGHKHKSSSQLAHRPRKKSSNASLHSHDNEDSTSNNNNNNNEDDENDNDNDNDNEHSEVSSERDWENSTSRTENDDVAAVFDEKSIYQQSTFVINQAPIRKTMKTFKLMLATSNDFGLTVDEMLTILEAAAPASFVFFFSFCKLVRKLKEFLEIKMPSGFPVQLELPLYHVLKATVTFQNFKEMEIDEDIFAIPQDYLLVEKDNVNDFQDDN